MENAACNKKESCFWKIAAVFMLGVIVGFMFAPIKKGMKICCDNKNSMNANSGETYFSDDDIPDNDETIASDWEDETEAYSF